MVPQTKATDSIVAVGQWEIHHKLIWRVEKAKRSDIGNKLDNWETDNKAVLGGRECEKSAMDVKAALTKFSTT